MTKSKKNVKATKAARSGLHRFIHQTRSRNTIWCELVLPRHGQVSRFDVTWEQSPSAADLEEQEPFLALMHQTASAIAGRRLTLRFFPERGPSVEFPAERETEAA
jgi:hypothetical protein